MYKLEFKPVAMTEVNRCLHTLGDFSSMDILDIDSNILKIATHKISKSLTMLFNMSLSTGCFPRDWKSARVIPICIEIKGRSILMIKGEPIYLLFPNPHTPKVIERI